MWELRERIQAQEMPELSGNSQSITLRIASVPPITQHNLSRQMDCSPSTEAFSISAKPILRRLSRPMVSRLKFLGGSHSFAPVSTRSTPRRTPQHLRRLRLPQCRVIAWEFSTLLSNLLLCRLRHGIPPRIPPTAPSR